MRLPSSAEDILCSHVYMFPSDSAHRTDTLIVENFEHVHPFFGKGPTLTAVKKDR
jgi:hypothetical protein